MFYMFVQKASGHVLHYVPTLGSVAWSTNFLASSPSSPGGFHIQIANVQWFQWFGGVVNPPYPPFPCMFLVCFSYVSILLFISISQERSSALWPCRSFASGMLITAAMMLTLKAWKTRNGTARTATHQAALGLPNQDCLELFGSHLTPAFSIADFIALGNLLSAFCCKVY